MKTSKKFYLLVVVLLALALALAACGDSPANTVAPAPTTKTSATTAASATTTAAATKAATTAAAAPKVGNELVGQSYSINNSVTSVVQVFNHTDLTISDIGTVVKPKNGLFLVVKYSIDNKSQVEIYDPFPSVVDSAGKVYAKGGDDNKIGSALVSQPQYKFDVPLAAATKGVMYSIFDVPATATGLQLSDSNGGTKFTSGGTASSTKPATTTTAATGGNTVNGLGISITFPTGWATTVQDKNDEGVLGGTNPDGSYITIFRFTKGEAVQGDLKTRSTNLLNNFQTSLADFKVLETPNQVNDQIIRFSMEFTDKKTNALNTEIVLVIDDATLKGTYLVEAGAAKTKFPGVSGTLVSILGTIKTDQPAATTTTAPASSKLNVVKGLGISLTYPGDWQAKVDDKDDGGSIISLNPERNYINIFRFSTGNLVQGELKDRTSAVLDYLKSVNTDLQVIEEPTVVSDDTARFSVQFTDKTTKVVNVELVLVIDDATLKGTYLVEAGTEKSKFDSQKDSLIDILNTIENS